MVVAPDSPVEAGAVALGNVHAAEIAYAAVDDDHFAVVAVIGRVRQKRKPDLDERLYLHARLTKTPVESFAEIVGGIIVLHPDFYAFSSLLNQKVRHSPAHGIVFELEELEMDVVSGGSDVAHHVVEHRKELCIKLDIVAGEAYRTVGGFAQRCKVAEFVLGRRDEIAGHPGRALLVDVEPLGGDQTAVLVAPSEKIVEDNAHHREESHDQKPCNGVDRSLVLAQDEEYHAGKNDVSKYPQ